jgi:hypothetical protein
MRIAILALSICAATPAFAGNNELWFGSFGRSLRTSSANAVTNDNLGGPQLGLARQLHLDLVTNLQLWATVGYGRGFADGSLFGMPTTIDTHAITLGGRARYELHPNLAISGRLDLGADHAALSIEGNGHTVSDGAWGGSLGGALGLDLLAVARPRFSFGMRFELGYVTASGVALSPAEGASTDMIELPASQASIGHLDLGGRYFALSLLSQF